MRSTSSGCARCLGGDLHLHIGHIGKGIHRQLPRRAKAEAQQHQRDHDDNQPLFERGADQSLDHQPSVACGCARC
jgi:hypothetical protein